MEENVKSNINLLMILITTALLASLITYQVMQGKLVANHPLTIDQQLTANELTYVNQMLLTDILQPSFKDVSLVAVSKTNSCSVFEKGCFGDRILTEQEFATYTGRGPQVSLFIYQTDKPITASDLQKLKTQLNTSPYTTTQENGATGSVPQDEAQPLYEISASAKIGDTQISVVVKPFN